MSPYGDVAYRLALPPALSRVHKVFHVSMLRKYVPSPEHIWLVEDVVVDNKFTSEERPEKIVDRKDQGLSLLLCLTSHFASLTCKKRTGDTLHLRPGKMPNIYNALVVKGRDSRTAILIFGNNRVRAVAMSATDGLMRGMEVVDTGAPLSLPVGRATLGRIFNVLGEPVDDLGPVDTRTTSPIHRSAPAFIQNQSSRSFSPLSPWRKNRTIRRSGGAIKSGSSLWSDEGNSVSVDHDFAGDENLGPLSLIRPRKMVLSLETPILDRQIENRCWDNDFDKGLSERGRAKSDQPKSNNKRKGLCALNVIDGSVKAFFYYACTYLRGKILRILLLLKTGLPRHKKKRKRISKDSKDCFTHRQGSVTVNVNLVSRTLTAATASVTLTLNLGLFNDTLLFAKASLAQIRSDSCKQLFFVQAQAKELTQQTSISSDCGFSKVTDLGISFLVPIFRQTQRHLCQIGTFSRCNQSLERLEHVFKQCPRAHQESELGHAASSFMDWIRLGGAKRDSPLTPSLPTDCYDTLELYINLIKGVSTPLKYLEVLKAHFSFQFPIARTNCWAKVRFSGKKNCGEKNENDRSVVTVNTVALTRSGLFCLCTPGCLVGGIGKRFPFRNLLHLNEVVRTATIEKNVHSGACNRPRKVDSTFAISAMISLSGGTGSATTKEETSPSGSSTCRIMYRRFGHASTRISRRNCISAADNFFTGGRGLVGGDGRRGGNADLVDVSEGEDELDGEVRIDEEGTLGFYRATELCNSCSYQESRRLGDDITSDLRLKTIKKEDQTKYEIGSKIADYLSSTIDQVIPVKSLRVAFLFPVCTLSHVFFGQQPTIAIQENAKRKMKETHSMPTYTMFFDKFPVVVYVLLFVFSVVIISLLILYVRNTVQNKEHIEHLLIVLAEKRVPFRWQRQEEKQDIEKGEGENQNEEQDIEKGEGGNGARKGPTEREKGRDLIPIRQPGASNLPDQRRRGVVEKEGECPAISLKARLRSGYYRMAMRDAILDFGYLSE
ncbi:hypothetical protein V8G54_000035 (mitochondrion) [Vigna mungo]|uniref:H(+)-transporting two-sector ATPase n=1 Tax=Vigna mungo TaxID=3915 RepID=A0AAQ3SHG6_VIGMU